MTFIFLLLCYQSLDTGSRNYLDQGLRLKSQLENERRSDLIRDYVFLLVDHHVRHVGFRSFALSNLSKTERLEVRRAQKNFVTNDYTQLVENNLEALLLEKSLRFPEDFDIQLAVAYYLHFAGDLLIKPQLKMTETQIWSLFDQAVEKGISTPLMKSEMVLHALETGQPLNAEQVSLAESAFAELPLRPQIIYTLLATRVQQKRHHEVIQLSKKLFEQTYAAKYRLFALVARSDALFELENFSEALKTVQVLLRLAPNQLPSWKKGFDLLLKGPDQKALDDWMDLWILSRPSDPARVMVVLDGLEKETKVEAYFRSFEAKIGDHPFPHVAYFQLATFSKWYGNPQDARKHLKKALEATPENQNEFKSVIQDATKALEAEG